jgi:hypothetical protein
MKQLREGAVQGLHTMLADGDGTLAGGLWSLCAWKFPRRTCEWLTRQDPTAVLRDRPETVDVAVGRLLAGSPWPLVAVHCPSLVEHVGDASCSAGAEPVRRARNFPGRDFDALSLGWGK